MVIMIRSIVLRLMLFMTGIVVGGSHTISEKTRFELVLMQ